MLTALSDVYQLLKTDTVIEECTSILHQQRETDKRRLRDDRFCAEFTLIARQLAAQSHAQGDMIPISNTVPTLLHRRQVQSRMKQ